MSEVTTRSKWIVDPAHSLIEFAVRHMMISTVKGRFGKIEGKIDAAFPDLATANVEISVDAASVDTNEAQRDEHMRSPDFFDVQNHPRVVFKSRQVEPTGENRYRVTGDLTMRGVTREIAFDATFEGQGKDPWGNERMALSAETTINRKDFGLNWNAVLEAGGLLVGEQVKVYTAIEAIRQN